MKFKNGPNAVAVGFTQASVSANNNPLPDEIATPTVSVREGAMVGSTIDKVADEGLTVAAASGDVGTTKAETPLIVIVAAIIAQHMTMVKRYILFYFLESIIAARVDGRDSV